jgi:riboflavin kinase/FMN adenylyltransferase
MFNIFLFKDKKLKYLIIYNFAPSKTIIRFKLKIFTDIKNFYARNPVVSIGIFDGVHVGHRKIIDRLKELAVYYDGETVLVTLWPHPKVILEKENNNSMLLTTKNEKELLLEKLGIDNLIVLPFTREFSQMTFREFSRYYLIDKIKVKHMVIGHNHHFGKDRKGSFNYLKNISNEYGFTVEQISPVIIHKSTVSSSVIRKKLENGNIESANEFLGYKYFINGRIKAGEKIGRRLGFPTANIELDDSHKLLPKNGVYAVKARLDKMEYKGMLYIGTSPTIKAMYHNKKVEVHLLDFQGEIYSKGICVDFIARIRDEIKFKNEEELISQIYSDKHNILSVLSK